MTDRDIKWAVEACRPGSEDVSLPEMLPLAEAIQRDPEVRRLYERSQQYDAVIRQAFCDVPVPDGLTERLLAAVQREQGSYAPEPQSTSGTVALDHPVVRAERETAGAARRPRRSSKSLFSVGIAGMALTVVGVAALVWVYRSPLEPTPGEALPREVESWSAQITRIGWRDDFSEPRLEKRPCDKAIRVDPQRWCEIVTSYDDQTIAYDLASPGDGFATLFCMRLAPTGSSQLDPIPPLKPVPGTGGVSLGVWRRGGLVYVLAVKGPEQRYRAFLESTFWIG
jgi:hypothetical protein